MGAGAVACGRQRVRAVPGQTTQRLEPLPTRQLASKYLISMNDRKLTIYDLEPLFVGRDVILARELWEYLRLSQIAMERYIRRAGIVRRAGAYYRLTRADVKRVIQAMLSKEGYGA